MPYGTPAAPGSPAHDQYEAEVASIDAAVATCSHCKAAATRKRNAEREMANVLNARFDKGLSIDAYHLARQNTSFARLNRATNRPGECQYHRDARRLAYTCSPVSETYWAS